mmetsp:Transcript_45448/g.81366  ORF Transcript_45448/g.81366 Transcript_45448/m.81366 type:complete len:123 (-) Transcript_45448:346-714(-)
MAPYDQYVSALRNFENKAGQLTQRHLSYEEQGRALLTWAYPVFDVVLKLVYPVQQVWVRVDVIVRQAVRMANWGLTDAINMQPAGTGGIRIILPSSPASAVQMVYGMDAEPGLLGGAAAEVI